MPTIQRVAAVEASRDGAARSSSAKAPPSAAARESRLTTTLSIPPMRISPITASTVRQRSASSIAQSKSRRCVTFTVTSRSGARPKTSRPAPCGAPLSARAIASAIQRMLLLSCPALCRASTTSGNVSKQDVDGRDIGEQSDAVLRTTMPGHDEEIPKANPVAAARWVSAGAAISCRAPRMSPPPSIVSIAAMPNGRTAGSAAELFSILDPLPGALCRARRRRRSCSIITKPITKPLKMRIHSAQPRWTVRCLCSWFVLI